jgi:glycerol uptake facilitator-like aquaporin
VRLRDAKKPAVFVGAGAEFLAVFMLVYWGRGTLIATLAINPNLTPSHVVAVSIAKGMAYAVAVYSFLFFSGAHVNSAVTIALFFTKHVSLFRALVYIASQVLGGIFGAAMLWLTIPEAYRANLGFPVLGQYAIIIIT